MTDVDPITAAGMTAVRRPAPPRRGWYRHVAAVRLQIDCSGGRHTVAWRRGRFVLLDHDVGAEKAMQALGADRPACLTLLERFRTTVTAPLPPTAGRRGALRSAAAAGGDLRSFGQGLAGVIDTARLVRAERRWADPDLPAGDRQRLVNALVEGLQRALGASLAASAAQRGRQQIALHARPVPSGEEPAAEVTTSAGRIEVDLQLPLRWVIDVAGRGLDDLDGRMALAVSDTDGARLGVTGIVWEVEGRGRVAARLERWWAEPSAGGAGWNVVDGSRPVGGRTSIWWSTQQR